MPLYPSLLSSFTLLNIQIIYDPLTKSEEISQKIILLTALYGPVTSVRPP